MQVSIADYLFGHNKIIDWIFWLDFVTITHFKGPISKDFPEIITFFWAVHFLFQPRVAYDYMNFQPESCLAVACSISVSTFSCLMLWSFDKIFSYLFMISASWSVDFETVLVFHIRFSSVCLFRVCLLRELVAKIWVSNPICLTGGTTWAWLVA